MSLLKNLFFQQPAVSFEPVRLDALGDKEIWNLKEPIDPIALDAFWTAVVKDIQSDPEWFSFVED